MKLIKNFRNIWNLASMCNDIPMYDTMKHMDFFAFTGNSCSPGFCIDLSSCKGIDEAYESCSPLSTVIGRNAQAMGNAKWWITDEKDNDVSSKYENISRLLKNPNPLQTWTEFMFQFDIYRMLYGEVFVWAAVPEGLDINEASSLWVIKPSYIEIDNTKKLYFQKDLKEIVNNYYLIIGTSKTKLNNEHILHIKDTYQNLDFSPLDLRGKSRMTGLEDQIKNIIQANEAIYSLNRDRGAQGILSNRTKDKIGALPLTPVEKENIQKTYNNNYGILKHLNKVLLTEASLDWQQMSFNVKDLMLYEGIAENIQQIADAYDYPYGLLGGGESLKYNNMSELKRVLYQDNTIPMAGLYSEKFTGFFNLGNDRIYADFSHVEALKESEKEKATALHTKVLALDILWKSKLITLEEYRLALDYDIQMDGKTLYNGNESTTNQEKIQQEGN